MAQFLKMNRWKILFLCHFWYCQTYFIPYLLQLFVVHEEAKYLL
jgi:hypothetical protein